MAKRAFPRDNGAYWKNPAAFRYVVNALSCEPSEILFLDDSQMNVDAARRVGMNAERVSGLDQVERVLAEKGALAGSLPVLPLR
ncbi:MAG: HAD-IA family hydrolase [Desulfatirhabdiaceae bacterium]|nr:HAD-IA family hydrolase [Desulfatirhabdiaceae bacterium]